MFRQTLCIIAFNTGLPGRRKLLNYLSIHLVLGHTTILGGTRELFLVAQLFVGHTKERHIFASRRKRTQRHIRRHVSRYMAGR